MSWQIIAKFKRATAWVAARLPGVLAEEVTLMSDRCGHWYSHNGYYKFGAGTKINIKDPSTLGFGSNPNGWVVVGYENDTFGYNAYLIQPPVGEVQLHSKWNMENLFQAEKQPRFAKIRRLLSAEGSHL